MTERAFQKFALVIPTLNEAGSIREVVERAHAALASTCADWEIVVVDDASTDGTPELVEAYAREHRGVKLIRRNRKRGLAGAILCGWEHTTADLLGVMDADLQHPADTLPRLVAEIRGGAEIAIASRYVLQQSMDGWNPLRKLLSRASVLASVPVQRREIRVKDPLSGFFVVQRECIEGLQFQQTGFKLLLEILVKGRINSVSEVPFTFGTRTRDKSKAGFITGAQYAFLLSKLLRTPVVSFHPSPTKKPLERPLEVILGLLPLILGLQIIIWALYLPSSLRGYADFRNCYTAAVLVRTGHAHHMYDYGLQKQVEDAYIGHTPALLPFVHLPYEALIFVPFSLLPYSTAYLCWLAVNVVLCILCYFCLKARLSVAAQYWHWLPIVLVLGFSPVAAALMQGQDSVLTVLLFAAALIFAGEDRDILAGALIGLAIYKFQLVLPFAALFFLWRRMRVLIGLSLSALAAIGLSLLVSGSSELIGYVASLPRISTVFTSGNVMLYHMPVAQMPNLRGAISLIPRLPSRFALALLVAMSTLIMASAFWVGRHSSREWQLALAVCATTLVSYHVLMHDLSILLLPLAVLISSNRGPSSWIVPVMWLSPALCWFGLHPVVTASVLVFFCVLLSEARAHPALRLVSGPFRHSSVRASGRT